MDGESICSGSTTELKATWVDLMEDFEEEETSGDRGAKDVVYVGGSEYWLHHGNVTRLSLDEFDNFSRTSFSMNFFWLLGECSKLIGQSTKDVYVEVVQVERVFFPSLSSTCRSVSDKRGVMKYW
jgi:hypothetical protein